jgi:cysteinyl-tRNA synthetase
MTAQDSVHELASARQAARAEKNFALSDQLRDEIAAQ